MLENYILSSCFMLIVLSILAEKCYMRYHPSYSRKLCIMLISSVFLYVLMDALCATCFLAGNIETVFFQVIMFVFYIIYIVLPFVWHSFIRNYNGCSIGRNGKILETIPFIILLLLVLTNPFTGFLWKFSNAGEYVRGNLFSFFSVMNLFYYVEALMESVLINVRNHNRKDSPYFIQSVFITIIPLLAILVNCYIIPVSITYPVQPFCLVVVTLMSFFFIVDRENEIQENIHKKELQDALTSANKAMEKATKAGEAKTTFLANMSHDIRTPLNAILGYSQVISNDPSNVDVVRSSVEKIQVSGDVLLSLVNDVLDYSKIESDFVQLNEEPTDLAGMIESLRIMFSQQMLDKGICFHINADSFPSLVICDNAKLQQILVNVLGNAMKYTPSGGCVTFSVWHENGQYVFDIADTGIGISKEFQTHMFDAFEREYSATNIKVSGTGLGLAIVKRLTDMMHGTIHVLSETGQGTKITLTFSFSEIDKFTLPSKTNTIANYTRLDGIRILIAEDNDLNSELEKMILSEKGACIEIVKDGKQAIETFKNHDAGTYDVILMDMMMPVMDGLQATRQIRSLPREDAKTIPIIGLTANAFKEDAQKCKEAGMNEHVSKPIQVAELVNLIGYYVYEIK